MKNDTQNTFDIGGYIPIDKSLIYETEAVEEEAITTKEKRVSFFHHCKISEN